MNKQINNENLVNNSNLSQKEQKMILQIDGLLLQRLPELLDDELKWIRKEYGNDELSEFLNGDSYYSNSLLLNGIAKINMELFTDKKFCKVYKSLQ